jgi:ribosomal protein S12 methylthiotransferase accessory factor YcaO
MYKLSEGLARAFKNNSSLAQYSEGAGVVPTHAGGGTRVGDGAHVSHDETMIHERAAQIVTVMGGHITHAQALVLAREEASRKAAAENRGGTPVDPNSVLLDKRAKEILKEKKWDAGRYGTALNMARQEQSDKALAEKRSKNFSEGLCFDEGSRIPISQASILLAERANAIIAENNWPGSRFGLALQMARAEAATT